MMETFKNMVNFCIRIGLEENITTLRKFSSLHYKDLDRFEIQSYYKLTAISQAMGRLAQMKNSIRRGKKSKPPYINKLYLISCYRFKINGMLMSIPIGNRSYSNILLNQHTVSKLSEGGIEPRSFVITPKLLSICIKKKVNEIKYENVIGIDRNLRNITVGNEKLVTFYNTNKLLSIKENTSHVIASFKRNDFRVKRFYQRKFGNRRTRRVQQFLHKISKDVVNNAVETKSMIIFEDLKGIRKLYRKGNGQGNKYRRRLNSWSFYELQRQIEYKAKWEGIPVIFVDPKCTSKLCPICGDRIQEDRQNRRKLWCSNCKRSMDRDVVASMNIAYKGRSRFILPRGGTVEAMKRNMEMPLILRVDVSKSNQKIRQNQ